MSRLEPPDPKEGPERGPSLSQACRILLAEDHPFIRERLRILIESAGYEVVGEASDGAEATRLAGVLAPDVAILDISLPVLDGLAAGNHVRRASPQTALIALSSDADEMFLTAAREAGFLGCVAKHQATEHLVRAIQHVRSGAAYFEVNDVPGPAKRP